MDWPVGLLKRAALAWRGAPRWAVVTGLVLLVLLGASACKNADKAKLLSLPVPVGSEFEDIQAPRWWGVKQIVYRVPLSREEAEAEVYRVFEEDGWRRRGRSQVARDDDCIFIHVQGWSGWGSPTEFGWDDNSLLVLSLEKPEYCGLG